MKHLALFLFIFSFFIQNFTANGRILNVPGDYSKIQTAVNAANPHDTILVKPGRYHEFLVLKDSINLIADGVDDGNWNRAKVTTVHSEGLRDSAGNVPPVINCANGCIIDGFEVTGMDSVNHHLPGHSHAVQNRGTSSKITNCIVHDNGSTGIGSHEKDGKPSEPIIIHNKVYRNFGIGIGFNHFARGVAAFNLVFDNREVGIGTQNGASPLIDNNIVYGNGWNGIAAREGSKPVIRSNVSYSNGTDRTGAEMPVGAGVGIGADSTGWLTKNAEPPAPVIIENNTVFDNPGGGIMCRNRALVTIRGNSSYDNEPFQIVSNDSTIALIDSNYAYQTSNTNYQGGGIVINRNSQTIVKNNRVSHVDLAGIMIGGDSKAAVTDNIVDSCKLIGIRIDSNVNKIKISGNKIRYNSSLGISIVSGNAGISHNLLVRNANGGISSDENSVSEIFNNTIVNDSGTTGRGIFISTSGSKVFNNIITGYTLGVFKNQSPYIDYNCTFQNTGYNGPPGTGGSNAIAKNPEFINPTINDYHLKSISPCINSGNPDPLYNDPDGSRSDIGCYPYTGSGEVFEAGDESDNFYFLPNIASSTISVYSEMNPGSEAEINIYINTGEKIISKIVDSGKFLLDISQIPDGYYFVRFSNNGKIKVKPLIIIH